jgi:hypothetical protein
MNSTKIPHIIPPDDTCLNLLKLVSIREQIEAARKWMGRFITLHKIDGPDYNRGRMIPQHKQWEARYYTDYCTPPGTYAFNIEAGRYYEFFRIVPAWVVSGSYGTWRIPLDEEEAFLRETEHINTLVLTELNRLGVI